MTNSLQRAGARGGGVTLIGQAGRMIVQLAGIVVLARLLEPEDFGLIAMVAVFMTLADLLRDFGLSTAALQAKELSRQQASNLFWVSWGLGTLSGIALAAATPLLVALYGEPRLGQIVPALALTLLLGGAQAQVQVHLARHLQFSVLALSQLLAPAVGLGLAIVAALAGWGYWALVVQAVGTAFVLLIIQALGARWVPSRPRKGHGTASLLVAGAQMGATHVLTWAAGNVDSLVIGARFGAVSLGYYSRAFQLTATMIGGFLAPLTQVAVPMLNKAEEAGRRPADLLLRLQFLIAAPVSVGMVALALTAPSLIPLVLGDEWAPASPLVQILAVAECIHALSFVSYWGFLAERLPKQLLYYNLATKPLTVAAVIVGSIWGVEGIAWGYAAGLALSWPINLAWLTRTARFDGMKFLLNGLRILATAGATYTVVFLILSPLIHARSWLAVLVVAASAVLVFVGFVAMLPAGRRDLVAVAAVIRSLR